MRRGRGRGNNHINMGRNSEAPGPLMTEHIRNLDMELELLKRKREMIEQQQQLLNRQMDYDNQRQYIPPLFGSNSRAEPSSNRNFSQMYDDTPTPDYIPLNSGIRKRPSEPSWRDNSQPKRFSGPGPKRGAPRTSYGPRPAPAPAPSAPRRQPPPNQKPKAVQSQSFKAKPSGPPNKLATYPVSERKTLVTQAVKATNKAMVLRADRTPSVQLNGRLELALGHLLKDIKAKYGGVQPYTMNFMGQATMKPMKQMIRERIWEVMMDKEVGALPDIMIQYRNKYPLETDLDIVNEGLAHQRVGDVTYFTRALRAEKPEKYYKENITLMVDQKLHQMFMKLADIYSLGAPNEETAVELTPIQKPAGHKMDDADFSKDVVIEPEENQVIDKADGTLENENNDEPMENEHEAAKENEETVEKEETVPKAKEGTASMELDDNAKAQVDETPAKEKVILDKLIEQKLPALLKKHIPFIKHLLNLDEMVKAIKKSNTFEVNKRQMMAEVKEPRPPPKFYVKIYGRKDFPKKNAMQEFLKPFQPRSVKKHKAMSNLLFVGFDNKESFEKILEANGVIVGKCSLQITVSENKKDKRDKAIDEKSPDDVQIIEEENTISQDEENLIKDLDNQITDLLSSIRKAEESNTSITIEDDEENSQVDEVIENTIKADPGNNDPADEAANNDVNENGKEEDAIELKKEPVSDETAIASVKPEPITPTKNLEVIREESPAIEENAQEKSDGKKIAADAVKNDATVKATPTRASSRLAAVTPSTVRTRRSSKLAQNNQ